MDYIRQLNGFWAWRMTQMLTHVQADLYFTLLSIANRARWPSPLSIPNSTIIGTCQICRTELHRQRLNLVEMGLIEYSKGRKGTAGLYIIVPLYEITFRTNPATNPGTNPGTNLRNISKTKTNTKTYTYPEGKSYDLDELEEFVNRPIYDDGDDYGEN
jgi:hypothetical protein